MAFGHRFGIFSSTLLCETERGWIAIEVFHSSRMVSVVGPFYLWFSCRLLFLNCDDTIEVDLTWALQLISCLPLFFLCTVVSGVNTLQLIFILWLLLVFFFSLGVVKTRFILIAQFSSFLLLVLKRNFMRAIIQLNHKKFRFFIIFFLSFTIVKTFLQWCWPRTSFVHSN